LGAGVAKIREALATEKAVDRQSLAPPVYEIRRVVKAQSGPSPQRVLEFSEGLWAAEVSYMSALVGWSWARPYQAQAMAVIGLIAARTDVDKVLRPMWPGLEYVVKTDLSILDVAGDEKILTWTPAQHRLIYDAWTEWMASNEDVDRLPEPFQIYIAVAKIAAVGRSVHGRVVLGAARNAIGEWMREQHPSWAGYETYPTAEEERLLDTMQRA
ncbi:MAG TPA: hypothetical protein VMV82_02685, partial [Candidatus Dormibacteraeota bacterium]|nr:hypothetical protein [Candidatus Dormibacteraeota bacterium]